MLTSTRQPERLVCSPARVGEGWELRLRLQSSDPRERTGVDCVKTPEGVTAPQLARRESRGKSGTAKEAKDHSFRVREERAFLPHVLTETRAPPKLAPEMGTSHGYQLGPQRWARNAKAATAATKNPVCKHRSLSTMCPTGTCAACHARVP